ncbi:MAG: hypothetical protein ABEJ28_11725 [Salinigranum sp.]
MTRPDRSPPRDRSPPPDRSAVDPGDHLGRFPTRVVLLLGALLIVSEVILPALGVPLPFDTVVGVAAAFPVLHYRGVAHDSPAYRAYVSERSGRELLVDSLAGVVGAVAAGVLLLRSVDWALGRAGLPFLMGVGAAGATVGGAVVLSVWLRLVE